MSEAKALGMSAETNSRRCLSPASSSSVGAQCCMLEAILKGDKMCVCVALQ